MMPVDEFLAVSLESMGTGLVVSIGFAAAGAGVFSFALACYGCGGRKRRARRDAAGAFANRPRTARGSIAGRGRARGGDGVTIPNLMLIRQHRRVRTASFEPELDQVDDEEDEHDGMGRRLGSRDSCERDSRDSRESVDSVYDDDVDDDHAMLDKFGRASMAHTDSCKDEPPWGGERPSGRRREARRPMLLGRFGYSSRAGSCAAREAEQREQLRGGRSATKEDDVEEEGCEGAGAGHPRDHPRKKSTTRWPWTSQRSTPRADRAARASATASSEARVGMSISTQTATSSAHLDQAEAQFPRLLRLSWED